MRETERSRWLRTLTTIIILTLLLPPQPAIPQSSCRLWDRSYPNASFPCYGDYWTLIAYIYAYDVFCDTTWGYQTIIRDACTGPYFSCDGNWQSGNRYTGRQQMVAWTWEPQQYQVYWLTTHQDVRLEWCGCEDGDPNKSCAYEVRWSFTFTEGWEYGQCCWR
jgi:hypothetical protein